MKSCCALILFVFLFSACSNKKTVQQKKLLARVGSSELYDADLKTGFTQGFDSMAVRKRLVTEWVKNQLIYNQAVKELSSAEKNKDRELKNYYESLIRFEYMEKLTNTFSDTLPGDKDIEDYYRNNQKNFELKRNIIRFLYVKLPNNIPLQQKVRDWIQTPTKQSLDSLRIYARKYASNAMLDTLKWYYFSDITKEIPILEDYSPEHFIRTNDYVELKDGQYAYLINIFDGKIKDETAPLSLVKDKIRTIIINRRKTERQKEIESRIYKDAKEQHQFEIYGMN
jgi:hypothetical protein